MLLGLPVHCFSVRFQRSSSLGQGWRAGRGVGLQSDRAWTSLGFSAAFNRHRIDSFSQWVRSRVSRCIGEASDRCR
eukprot:8023626-Alexandrium_andersonii.AAC.1